jgi:hypothetical protein
MKQSIISTPLLVMAALARGMGIKIPKGAGATSSIRTLPGACRPMRNIGARPEVGWRKAASLRRHKKIMAKRRANSRRGV